MQAAINTQTLESFQGARIFHKVKRRLPIKITTDQGQIVFCSLYDISPDGLQVRCERDMVLKINPEGLQIDELNPINVVTTFPLPVADEIVKITIHCEVSYIAIIPDNINEQFAIGLKFNRKEGQVISNVGGYLFDELAQSSQDVH